MTQPNDYDELTSRITATCPSIPGEVYRNFREEIGNKLSTV